MIKRGVISSSKIEFDACMIIICLKICERTDNTKFTREAELSNVYYNTRAKLRIMFLQIMFQFRIFKINVLLHKQQRKKKANLQIYFRYRENKR